VGTSSWFRKGRPDVVRPLFTIGYEHATAPAVLGELRRAGVGLLVHMRAVAASRRPGFSKRALAAGLDEQGIGYLHLRGLGTPTEGRQAARSGKPQDMFRIYEAHLASEQAQRELVELKDIVRSGRRVCLLCYERDPEHCHLRRVAELVCDALDLKVENLFAPPSI
jgi:uncharacterized protein (DUF488 family)